MGECIAVSLEPRLAFLDIRVIRFLCSKMSVKETCNASSGVHRGGFVITDASKAQQLEPQVLLVVHERVSGIGIFLHIVSDEGTLERVLKLVSHAPFKMALRTVAADDRAGGLEEIIHVARKFSAVVDACCRESVARD